MSDSKKDSPFLTRIEELVKKSADGHLFISAVGEEIVINASTIDLESLVNMTSSLMRYTGIEYAKYLTDIQGYDVDIDHALRTLTEGTISSITEMEFKEGLEEL